MTDSHSYLEMLTMDVFGYELLNEWMNGKFAYQKRKVEIKIQP